jgi:hypothetical protein
MPLLLSREAKKRAIDEFGANVRPSLIYFEKEQLHSLFVFLTYSPNQPPYLMPEAHNT